MIKKYVGAPGNHKALTVSDPLYANTELYPFILFLPVFSVIFYSCCNIQNEWVELLSYLFLNPLIIKQ